MNRIGKFREKLHRETGNAFRDFGYPNIGHFSLIHRVLLTEHNFEPFSRLQCNCKNHFFSLDIVFVTPLKNLKDNFCIEVKFFAKLLNYAIKNFPKPSNRVPEKEISGFGKYRVVKKR